MSRERRTLRLLHTADVHLGATHEGERPLRAFATLIDHALGAEIDGFIVAGDLFDHNRVTAELVEFAAAQINRLAVPCFLLPGNHDQFDEASVYRRFHLPDLCPNLYLFVEPEGVTHALPELDLTVWGRPVVDHHPSFRPLADPTQRSGDGWHVVLGHGHYFPNGDSEYRSSPILPAEIAALDADYLALGHIHRFIDVSGDGTVGCYPGSTLSVQTGGSHTGQAVIVDLHPTAGVTMRPFQFTLADD